LSVSEQMLESALRKLIFATMTALGIGYILVNIATTILLGYFLSEFTISSVQIVIEMCGMILFLLASIAMVTLGILFIIGGLQYYRGDKPKGVIFLGTQLASFYLLCLGTGSALLLPQINVYVALLIIGPIFIMIGTAFHVLRPFHFQLISSILGIVGGALLAFVILDLQIFVSVFGEWNVPFSGPFMSMTILEAAALILGSVAVSVHSILGKYRKSPVKYVFFPIATLVYGTGVFIGSLIHSLGLLDLIWKAPWLPPLYGVPAWVINTTIFWAAGLIFLSAAGIMLVISSYMGFHFATSVSKEE